MWMRCQIGAEVEFSYWMLNSDMESNVGPAFSSFLDQQSVCKHKEYSHVMRSCDVY